MALDMTAIRRQFPFLKDGTAVYLDNAATTQKPQAVIDAMSNAMIHPTGNVHRGQHRETDLSTQAYEKARATVQSFINAKHSDEIIFTKNATEAVNLVAHSWARTHLKRGDAVALSIAEHHANVIPWLQLKEEKGIELRWIGLTKEGGLDMDELNEYLKSGAVKLLAITGQSNVLGTRPCTPEIVKAVHDAGAKVLVDAAQLAAHAPIAVQEMKCDFLVFSGHKIYGPTGIGVLYASRAMQKEMAPFMGGGGMVENVTLDGFTPADGPAKFEAGTPPIIEAIGLAAAIDWQKQFDWKDREAHEVALMKLAMEELLKIDGLRIISSLQPPATSGCISFVIDGIHPHDLTDMLGQKGIALRGGHHCAQPLHKYLKIPASTRLSIGLYTTEEEIKTCVSVIKEVIKKFQN